MKSGCGHAGASEAGPYVRPRVSLASGLASSTIKPRASQPYVYTVGTRSGRKVYTANYTAHPVAPAKGGVYPSLFYDGRLYNLFVSTTVYASSNRRWAQMDSQTRSFRKTYKNVVR